LDRSKLFINDTPHKTQLFPKTVFPVWGSHTLLLITLQTFADLKSRIKLCSVRQGVQKFVNPGIKAKCVCASTYLETWNYGSGFIIIIIFNFTLIFMVIIEM
jgi:hypothetical protein